VHESTILSFPAPTCIAHPVQNYCTTIEQYSPHPPTSRLYPIHHTILVITISCKGRGGGGQSGVDALDIITISRECFGRCCSSKKTPPCHCNLSIVTLRSWRPTLLRAPADRTASEVSPRRLCGHASRLGQHEIPGGGVRFTR